MESHRSIRRSRTDAKLTGLCGGVARRWGIDPVLVRVGAVLLALSGGVGLIVYLAGWLLIPRDEEQTTALEQLTGVPASRWPRGTWIAIVVVISVITLAVFGTLTPFSLWPAAVLAAIWYFGYYKTRGQRSRTGSSGPDAPPLTPSPLTPSPLTPSPPTPSPATPPATAVPPPPRPEFRYPGPATPFTEAATAWRRRMEEHLEPPSPEAAPVGRDTAGGPTWPTLPYPDRAPDQRLGYPANSPTPASTDAGELAAYLSVPDPVGLYHPTAPATAAASPSRRRQAVSLSARRLRLTGLIVLGLTLTALAGVDAAGVRVGLTGYLAAALLVVGLTLVAATWLGRARGILPIGLVLLLSLGGVTAANAVGGPRTWYQEVSYASLAELPNGGNRLDVGYLEMDLRRLDVTRDATHTVHVGWGGLKVTVPPDANVRVRYLVNDGVVDAYDQPTDSGSDLRGDLPPPRSTVNAPTLTLDVSVDQGYLEIDS